MRRRDVWRCARVSSGEDDSAIYLFAPEAVWTIAAAYAACTALALARFNVETGEEDDHSHFSGLPSPAAAASIAGFGILFYQLRRSGNQLLGAADIDSVLQTVLPLFAIIVGLLMVSRIPYPHVVNQALRGQRSFGHVVGLLFASRLDHGVPRLFGADHWCDLCAGAADSLLLAAIWQAWHCGV